MRISNDFFAVQMSDSRLDSRQREKGGAFAIQDTVSISQEAASMAKTSLQASLGITPEAEIVPPMSQVHADFMTYTHSGPKGKAEWSTLDVSGMSLDQLNTRLDSITEQIASLREELSILQGLGQEAADEEKDAGSEIKQQIKQLQNDMEKILERNRSLSINA